MKVQGADPPHPSAVEAKLGQGCEQKVPFYPIESFFEIQQEEDQLLVALHGPIQGVLGYEDIVENIPTLYEANLIRPDNTWEEGLQPPDKGFGQNFINTPQENDRPLIPEFGAVSCFGNQGDKPPVNVIQGLSRGQHGHVSFEECGRHFRGAGLEELNRNPVVSGRFAFGQRLDRFVNLFQGEILGECLVHISCGPHRDDLPTSIQGFLSAREMCFQGVKIGVELGDVMGEIRLTFDRAALCF
jgi:hypothetical protein